MPLFKKAKKQENLSKKTENKSKKSEKTSKSFSEIRKERKKTRTIQNAIDYDLMMKNGICMLNQIDTYSSCIKFSDINYQIATKDDQRVILTKYMELLNSLGNEENLQLLIHNRIIDEEDFERSSLIPEKDDKYQSFRNEWNNILRSKVSEGNNRITTDKYFIYNVVGEESYEKARRSVIQFDSEYIRKLKEIGCRGEKVNGYERLKLMHGIMKPNERFVFNYDNMDGLTTKDHIAPSQLEFKIDHFILDGQWCRVLFLSDYATELPDDMINQLCKLETNLTISFNMKAIPRGEDSLLVNSTLALMENEISNTEQAAEAKGYNVQYSVSRELRFSRNEAEEQLKEVREHNQRLFKCQFLVMLVCESKEKLEELTKSVKIIGKNRIAEFQILRMQQEEGFNACLPIGVRVKKRNRTLTTTATGIFIPFTSQELMYRDNALYYGQNSLTKNLIMYNRISSDINNPSGWYFGVPGSGKSFAIKREIAQVIYRFPDDDIIIIDPENEYRYMINNLGGTVVNVDNRSDFHINPLDGDINEKDFLISKVEFCQTFVSQIFGREMMAIERSIIDRCVRSMFSKYFLELKNDPSKQIPTLKSFYDELISQPEADARDLATGIEMYVNGSYDLFSGQSSLQNYSRLLVYNIQQTETTIKGIAMSVILESIWKRVVSNYKKGIRTWIWIDEVYVLFKYEFAAQFLYESYKRFRKYGAIVSSCTQNVSDLLSSPTATSMLSNSDFVYMLGQAEEDRIQLGQILHISPEQLSYVSNPDKGCGLLYNGNHIIIPFEDRMPKGTVSYTMMTSDFDERKQIREGTFTGK